jgi:hypothetical protein
MNCSINSPLEMNALLTPIGNTLSSNNSTQSDRTNNGNKLKSFEIPLSRVRFLQELGEGSFGKINQKLLMYYDKQS